LSAEILRVQPDEPEPEKIEYIVRCLRTGSVVGLPTDTFYGLAVDPVNLHAVELIYDLKMRLRHKPLSLLLADVAQAYEIARNLDSQFDRLAERFWPGPLTVIVRAGTRAVVRLLGLPVTATSANAFGAPECTHAIGVRDQLGDRLPLIVDGGPTGRSLPTTIVDLSAGPGTWQILREGAIPTHEIAFALQ